MIEFLKNLGLLALLASVGLCAGCGGGEGGVDAVVAPPPSEGLWTDQRGLFVLIAPSGEAWMVDGASSPPTLLVGKATETANGTTSVEGWLAAGSSKVQGRFAGHATPGIQLSGTLTEGGQAARGLDLDYVSDYGTHANAGRFAGIFAQQGGGSLTLQHDGTFSAASGGCTSTGRAIADDSGRNFFRVEWHYGPAPCARPGQIASGVMFPWGLTALLVGLSSTPGEPVAALVFTKS